MKSRQKPRKYLIIFWQKRVTTVSSCQCCCKLRSQMKQRLSNNHSKRLKKYHIDRRSRISLTQIQKVTSQWRRSTLKIQFHKTISQKSPNTKRKSQKSQFKRKVLLTFKRKSSRKQGRFKSSLSSIQRSLIRLTKKLQKQKKYTKNSTLKSLWLHLRILRIKSKNLHHR